MVNFSEIAATADVWTTRQTAEFLNISRQAINKRVQNRKLLGYPGRGGTLFPVWQFDMDAHRIHPELPEFLAAFDDDVTPVDIAHWSTTRVDGADRTPAELLLSPDSTAHALRLAAAFDPAQIDETDSPADESDNIPAPGNEIREWTPTQPGSNKAQQDILLAAADLFSRKGPAKVSLREIAAEANVSYGLIHRFYRTKENLLAAVMQLLVSYGGERLSDEDDAYAAIDNSFGADADAGQFGRMLTWSVFEGTRPDRLLGPARSSGYRSQIEALWANPVEPRVRSEFDSHVLASLVALVGSVWDLYEPYLSTLADNPGRSREDVRQEVTEMLKVLMYATRPNQ